MKKTRIWNVDLSGKIHQIKFVPKFSSFDQDSVEIDGIWTALKPASLSQLSGYEHIIEIGDHTLYLQINGRIANLAADGFFLGSEKPYTPIKRYPVWEILYLLLYPTLWLAAGLILSALKFDVEIYMIAMILIFPFFRFCLKTATSWKPTKRKIISVLLYGAVVILLTCFVYFIDLA